MIDSVKTTYFSLLLATVILIFLVLPNNFLSQKHTINSENQIWLQYYAQTKLNDKFALLLDGGLRWKNLFEQRTQYIIRSGISYSLNPTIKVSTGFAHLGFYKMDQFNRVEFRPYQELLVNQKVKSIDIKHRIRLEERFFNSIADGLIQNPNSFNFRFRYSLMTNFPLIHLSKSQKERRISLTIGDEIFFNSGRSPFNTFDQNRFMVAPTLHINKDFKIAFTWSKQFASSQVKNTYTNTHVFWLQINHVMDWR